MATEEPDYDVVTATPEYEIRRYQPYIVAETDVSGDFGQAGNRAFRILAGYIFGRNSRPGVQFGEAASTDSGIKIEMTAPVISSRAEQEGKGYTYSFVMPAKFSLDSLPIPLDAGIRIRVVPERLLAVKQYSGRWSEGRYQQHSAQLLADLENDGIELNGPPLFARYNGPWTPWFLRRNEVMVHVADDS